MLLQALAAAALVVSILHPVIDRTENASRNIPSIGKNIPDTMCALGDFRNSRVP